MKARQVKKLLKSLLSGSLEVLRVPPGTVLAMYYPRDWQAEDVESAAKHLAGLLGCSVMPLPRGVLDVEPIKVD